MAQSNFATLSGSVTDQQSHPVTSAVLQLQLTATGESHSESVNGAGLFEIAGLKPGVYQLEIRANYDSLPLYAPGTHTAQEWFNTQAFLAPPAYTFGNAGRNTVYGPGMQTMDLALVRQFALTEKWRFQMRGEFFNALNHVNLGTPNRFVNTPQFGTITEAATPGREIQLSGRLSF